jgi:hypothetical protein
VIGCAIEARGGTVRRTLVLVLALGGLALAAPAGAASVKRTGPREYRVTVSGAPQADLTIARLDFRLGAHARHPTRRSLRVSLGGPTGLNYLAAARLLPAGRRTLTALVALVNRRPAGSLAPDLAFVSLDIAGTRLAHRPRVTEVVGAFAHRARASALAPPMCRQTTRTLAATDVATALESGPGFGFPPRTVVAESFDAACSRPVDPVFQRTVTAFGRCPPCGPPGPVVRAEAAAIPCPAAQPAIVCPE